GAVLRRSSDRELARSGSHHRAGKAGRSGGVTAPEPRRRDPFQPSPRASADFSAEPRESRRDAGAARTLHGRAAWMHGGDDRPYFVLLQSPGVAADRNGADIMFAPAFDPAHP